MCYLMEKRVNNQINVNNNPDQWASSADLVTWSYSWPFRTLSVVTKQHSSVHHHRALDINEMQWMRCDAVLINRFLPVCIICERRKWSFCGSRDLNICITFTCVQVEIFLCIVGINSKGAVEIVWHVSKRIGSQLMFFSVYRKLMLSRSLDEWNLWLRTLG